MSNTLSDELLKVQNYTLVDREFNSKKEKITWIKNALVVIKKSIKK